MFSTQYNITFLRIYCKLQFIPKSSEDNKAQKITHSPTHVLVMFPIPLFTMTSQVIWGKVHQPTFWGKQFPMSDKEKAPKPNLRSQSGRKGSPNPLIKVTFAVSWEPDQQNCVGFDLTSPPSLLFPYLEANWKKNQYNIRYTLIKIYTDTNANENMHTSKVTKMLIYQPFCCLIRTQNWNGKVEIFWRLLAWNK